ncbi:MAG: cytochrome c [Sulfuricurvum sp.]|uniref:c-type cytochrome n=1 Tax=Sulfuricurvum sp. IAE1 TaxID=2546102 RepID=UPI001404E590|nr:c-type cytochrome [Sulfuricurvum sp. IAE1]MDD3769692.1 c-type cytochrome [Sulfuricurvum sp.]MDD3769734.1 c-type cytochrome [Sulfuricurvum sp.]MDX9966878.1 c-type cytochrome [Sulfuricurvum sp.]
MAKLLLFFFPMIVFAAGDLYTQGKKLYFSKGCNGCHGISAAGSAQYPALAYRRKAFLSHKLKEYRAKKGSTQLSQMMIPFAMGLSDREIDALTTFLGEYREGKSTYSPDMSNRGDGGS